MGKALDPRSRLTPQMSDYDLLPVQWLPYIMFLHGSNYRSGSVNTDSHGLRWSARFDGEALGLETLDGQECCLLVGASAVFGVGATADSHTLPAHLSRLTGQPWLNFGGRAFSSTQELMLFQIFRNRLPKVRRILLFSGVNALTLHYLVSGVPEEIGGFFYWSHFREAMAEAMLSPRRRLLSRLLRPLVGNRVDFARVPLPRLPLQILGLVRSWRDEVPARLSLEERIADREGRRGDLANLLERDLSAWKALAGMIGAELGFVLQPMFNWTGKRETEEEAQLFAHLDGLGQAHFEIMQRIFDRKSHAWLRDRLEDICGRLRIPFSDMNTLLAPTLQDSQWLFVDRVHLTDLGNELVAQSLVRNGCAG